MKKLSLLLVAAVVLMSACKKDKGDDVSVFEGYWSGQFTGDDQGTWSVTISEDGAISGTGQTNGSSATFTMQGSVSGDGSFKATIGTVSTGSEFTGKLTGEGTASGTWKNTALNPVRTGTWTGMRQPD